MVRSKLSDEEADRLRGLMRIRDALREMVPGTEIIKQQSNASGLVTGYSRTWGCYWVAASQPKDFNLLHRIRRD